MAKNKGLKDYSAYVKLDALVSFTVRGESPEDALVRAREELKTLHLIADGLEHIDGSQRLQGIVEND